MEPSIHVFLQYGAMGILALAFLTLLGLFIRCDRRAQRYAERMEESEFDRKVLIEVVQANTAAAVNLASRIAEMNQAQERMTNVIAELAVAHR